MTSRRDQTGEGQIEDDWLKLFSDAGPHVLRAFVYVRLFMRDLRFSEKIKIAL